MRSGSTGRRVGAVVASLGLALVVGFAASALIQVGFTATNNGTGSAPVASTATWTLSSSSVSGLSPGSAAQVISGTATNVANQTQYIGTITPTVTSTSNAGCTAADFIVTPSAVNADIASGTTGIHFGTIAFNDTVANQDACQGVTVYLSFAST